jgi:RNA polymerase sigma-32 factor
MDLAIADLGACVRAARQYPLLSREEELALAERLRETGDPECARRLVGAHLRLVIKIAFEYRRRRVSLADLIQEGNLGLVLAVQHYDPTRGVRLSSYASYWIRALMLRWLLGNARIVKFGTTQRERRLFYNLARELGDDANDDLAPLRRLLTGGVEASLDAPVRGDTHPLADRLVSDEPDPEERVAAHEHDARVHERAEAFGRTLQGRERAIFQARWLDDGHPTLAKLGARHGISRERARQIERRTLDRLGDELRAEGLA